MDAKNIVVALLETEGESAPGSGAPENPELKHWEGAHEKLQHINRLRQRREELYQELEYGISLRRELARHGRKLEEVTGLIRGDFLTPGGPHAKYRRKYPKATHLHAVGAILQDGSHLMFDAPITVFNRQKNNLLPQYGDKTETADAPEKENPIAQHRSKMDIDPS